MKLSPFNLRPIFESLDQALADAGVLRELIVCGGAALLILDTVRRETRDLDVLVPEIDPVLKSVAVLVGRKFGLEDEWINNGPRTLALELPHGWETRTDNIYEGKALTIFCLGRHEMLLTKIYAFCDREDDWDDLKNMKPTLLEVEACYDWVLARDASVHWPKRVDECFDRLRQFARKRSLENV